jgi:site-specific DNA recombinase
VLSARYDDGGYSGGSIHRPALQRLLQDVAESLIDKVLIYKIDRFTRSLFDFTGLISQLDKASAGLVSVSQQFDTTASLGRLTLNILLSFAQFEREIAGERIRDKIAASKRRGMWMGGPPPLGYDIKTGQLVINPKEAEVVTTIFRIYLELECVNRLRKYLDQRGHRTKSESV